MQGTPGMGSESNDGQDAPQTDAPMAAPEETSAPEATPTPEAPAEGMGQ